MVLYYCKQKATHPGGYEGRKDIKIMKLNQKICDDILRYGTILESKEFDTAEGEHIRQYIIQDTNEERYFMTKINGTWEYMTRIIKG